MTASSGSPKEPVALYKQVVAIVSFVSTNIGLNVFNSWALHKGHWPDFHFPVFYTMWHMVVSAFAALLLLLYVNPAPTGLPSVRQFWDYKNGLLSIAACTTLNNGLNNISLMLVSLFVNQVIKCTAPMPSALFSYLFAGKTFSRPVLFAVFLIVAGSALANLGAGHSGSTETSILGMVICIISLIANSLKPVLTMNLMSTSTAELPKLAPTVILFYDCTISFVFMLLYWLLVPVERADSIAYLANPRTTLTGIAVIVTGAAMAFCFNLAVYYFIVYTSALTSTVGANGVKILLITASAISSGVHDFISWSGIVLVLGALVAYAALTFQEGHARELSRNAAASSGIPSRPVDVPAETSPLVSSGSRSGRDGAASACGSRV